MKIPFLKEKSDAVVVANSYTEDTAKMRNASRVTTSASNRGLKMSERAITNAYHNSPIARLVVDLPADMALSKWRTWRGDETQNETLEAAERGLDLQRKMIETLQLARKDGGAALLIGTSDEDYSEPLNVDNMGEGDIEFLTVLSRHMFSKIDINLDTGTPGFREAIMFHLTMIANPAGSTSNRDSSNKTITEIHPSRLVIVKGQPRFTRTATMSMDDYWGDSVLQSVMAGIDQLESWYDNTAQMGFEAATPVLAMGTAVPGPDGILTNAVKTDEEKLDTVKLLTAINDFKGVTGLTVLNKDTMTYEIHQINFTGIPDMVKEFVTRLSAEAGIPSTILFGQSAQGLNATGDNELNIFAARIENIQNLIIKPSLELLDTALLRHAGISDELDYDWDEVFESSDLDRARIFAIESERVQRMIDAGTIELDQGKQIIQKLLVASRLGVE
ncbi:MAG: DUF1073 domain-containing protein [Gammaproteobacteria bacterium]|nr:DUF1073 domain-containing protein [Gammaproteobacteria bacterium]